MAETEASTTDRPPAPGDLALVQAFVNTVDLETGDDQIATPPALATWLRDRGLLAAGENATDADLLDALALREALRALLYANCCGDDAEAATARATLDRLAERCPFAVRVDGEALRLAPLRGGVPGALARLLAIVYTAAADGAWSRLKACRNERCRWAFYDTSKNRSGAWCNMAVCGNRAKVRAYQQRRKS